MLKVDLPRRLWKWSLDLASVCGSSPDTLHSISCNSVTDSSPFKYERTVIPIGASAKALQVPSMAAPLTEAFTTISSRFVGHSYIHPRRSKADVTVVWRYNDVHRRWIDAVDSDDEILIVSLLWQSPVSVGMLMSLPLF